MEKRTFWNKFETFDREINKQDILPGDKNYQNT